MATEEQRLAEERRLEERRLKELRATSWGLLSAITAGLAFVALRYVLGVFGGWALSGQVFIALLWAAAWFAAGFLLGFLFGIPRAPGGTRDRRQSARNGQSSNAAEGDGASSSLPYQLRVNTNLEEISDWLTKILVGATLTQLVKIPAGVVETAKFMADGMGAPGSVTFAASILVYFSSVGFFAGYVLTRMFFSGAFGRSDSQLSSPEISALQETRLSLDPAVPNDPKALATARKSSEIRITDSLSGPVAAAVASGALLNNDTERAVQAAQIAVQKSPDDPRVHLNYAIALQRYAPSSDMVRQELETAVAIVNRKAGADVAEDIYNSIVYFYLYVPPAEGFTKAIEYGEQYLKAHTPSRQSLWVNLACAYGQQYEYLKSSASEKELTDIKKKAHDAIRHALDLNPQSAVRFRELATGSADPEDNDLQALAKDDDELRTLIGLT